MGLVISHNFSHNTNLASFSSHLTILNRNECLAPSFNIILVIVKVLISMFQPQKFTFRIILLVSQFQRSIHLPQAHLYVFYHMKLCGLLEGGTFVPHFFTQKSVLATKNHTEGILILLPQYIQKTILSRCIVSLCSSRN